MTNSLEPPLRIKPRIMPRNVSDFCASLCFAFPVQFIALFILPWLVMFLVSHSRLTALIGPLLVAVVFLCFSVSSVTLSDEGVRFNRLFGLPKFLPWNFISSIEVAPRRELIAKGWLWPLLPAREMTTSLTSLGHYRISWQGGFCYYPPADPEAFEKYVHRHLRLPAA